MTVPACAPAELIRVEKGAPTPEELAAITVALIATRGSGQENDVALGPDHPLAAWRRPDRMSGHRDARSWQTPVMGRKDQLS
ncbi:acyl-CoA carboxylase subunit epsilon [Streptomyces sp. NPDC019224]|uniref:acyl-CoA carboxylase subunit epsilon n=1 Tax=Streptomyces sp. NPDC019224 TaxID=3154484 RepID=UPI0033D519EB